MRSGTRFSRECRATVSPWLTSMRVSEQSTWRAVNALKQFTYTCDAVQCHVIVEGVEWRAHMTLARLMSCVEESFEVIKPIL